MVDITFLTEVDGPGRHGEFLDFGTNDPRTQTPGRPFQHDLLFAITVTRTQEP